MLNKNINLINTKCTENGKSHTVLQRQSLCFSSYKHHKWKGKLWGVGVHQRKKTTLSVPFILSRKLFKHLCFILLYTGLNILPKYTHFYISKNAKNVFYTLLLLVFKTGESFQCILVITNNICQKLLQTNLDHSHLQKSFYILIF